MLLSDTFMVAAVSFAFFDFLRGPRYDITCNASKMFPDERHDLIRSSLAANECYECVFTITAAGIRVRKTKLVRNGPAVEWCAEEKFTGRLTPRQLFARQGADGGSADDRVGIWIGGAGGRDIG